MIKRILITGVAGFVGDYLVELLLEKGYFVYGTKLASEDYFNDSINVINMNITDSDEVNNIVKSIKPENIIHLAGQSSVAKSWDVPDLTMTININGTLNLLEAVREYSPNTRMLLIGSSEEYGDSFKKDCCPAEDTICEPINPYAISKCAQKLLMDMYVKAYNLNILATRSFNHIGPAQSLGFVLSDFCKQVVDIEKELVENLIHVGNLSAYRDFTDVRDIVEAYVLLIENGLVGSVYNIGSSKPIEIQDLLNRVIAKSSKKINVIVDKKKIRPIDIPLISANANKINNELGWSPKIDIDTTILDTLNYFRSL